MSSLFVVATPIGNLQDISKRALEVLSNVSLIVAEDTRHTGILLKHYNLSKKCISLHKYNEAKGAQRALDTLGKQMDVALVSNAGTPCISDPGALLVKLAGDAGFTVIPIPGPCAAVAALSVSGKNAASFVFEGFLPRTQSKRLKRLTAVKEDSRTTVIYESRYRILKTLKDIDAVFGTYEIVCAKELTKINERVIRGPAEEIARIIIDKRLDKGEFVIVI